MAKGITSGGVDFDDLFDPDVVGDGPSTPWLTSGGVALRYAALAYGTKRADVGYRNSAGVDVTNLWAAKGTAVYVNQSALPALLRCYIVNSSGPVTSTATFTFQRNGIVTFFPADYVNQNWVVPTGTTAGDAYDIRFTLQAGGNSTGTLTGTLGTWLQIDQNRGLSLSYTRSTSGSLTARRVVLVEIRRRSDNAVVYSFVVTMEAESDIS